MVGKLNVKVHVVQYETMASYIGKMITAQIVHTYIVLDIPKMPYALQIVTKVGKGTTKLKLFMLKLAAQLQPKRR